MEQTATRKNASFQAFFRNELLPVLNELEATRKRRLPTLAGLFLALNILAVAASCAVFPPAWENWHILVAETVLLTVGVVAAGRLGWRGMDKANESAPAYFQIILTLLLVVTAFCLSSFPVMGRRSDINTAKFFIGALIITLGAATGILRIIDQAFFDVHKRRVRFSKEIVKPVADYALPGMLYTAFEGVRQSNFLDSCLFPPHFNIYHARDQFAAKRNGYNLLFSWLNVELMEKDSKGKKVSQQHIFSGWFFVVDFARKFHGETLVLPDVAEAKLGWLGRSLQGYIVPRGGNLIHLEDVDFERAYKVISTGQLDARYILTPAFMRLAAAVRKRMGCGLSMSFKNNRMYVAVPAAMEYFGFLPNQSFTDPTVTRTLYHSVRGVADLAAEIAGNQVIWTDNAPM